MQQACWSEAVGRTEASLVAVLVCLLVLTMIVAGLLRTMFTQLQQARLHQRRLQTVWLAESALELAVVKLRAAADYRGETRQVPVEHLAGTRAGRVEIQVRAVADRPNRRKVLIVADYPIDPPHRIRHRKEILIDLP